MAVVIQVIRFLSVIAWIQLFLQKKQSLGTRPLRRNGNHRDQGILHTFPWNVALRHIARKETPELPVLKKE